MEYKPGFGTTMYDLIIGKSTMHKLWVMLDFKESTIQIDETFLPMRDIAKLQLKLSITRALIANMNYAQEPVSTCTATKRVVEILDAKYEKVDNPAIVEEIALTLVQQIEKRYSQCCSDMSRCLTALLVTETFCQCPLR